MKILILFLVFVGGILFQFTMAQSADKIVFNDGVTSYRKGDYKNAQEKFENVVAQNPQNNRAIFNAGNAAFLNGDFEKAKNYFTTYSQNSSTPQDKSRGFYNLGNVHLQEGLKAEANPQTSSSAESNFKNAISAYKESLKYNPSDEDAKYNLTYTLNKLKQLQQNKQDQNKDNKQNNENNENQKDPQQNDSQNKEEQNKDQQDNKGQNKDQQDDKNKEANNDKENQENPSKNEDNKEGNDEKKEVSPTKEKAEKDLDALNNEERKVLQRVAGTKSSKTSSSSLTKDW